MGPNEGVSEQVFILHEDNDPLPPDCEKEDTFARFWRDENDHDLM